MYSIQQVKLKHQYKLRLFIDDSCAFGVLGATGRGVIEHYNLDISMDIDMIGVSLEFGTAAYGGFCCGTHYIIDHQRLSGLGYCFSASLPPLQAAVGIKSINLIEHQPELVSKLRKKCIKMDQLLSQYSDHLQCDANSVSPIKHLRFTISIDDALNTRIDPTDDVKQNNSDFYLYKERTSRELDTFRLEKVVDYVSFLVFFFYYSNGLLITYRHIRKVMLFQ